jgi:tripartite-type tricarboxylate transporter receptor subunit TctC
MAEVIGHVRAGKLKVLAIVGKKRSPGSPDTGTFIEQGYEITQSHAFGYLFGPKGLPEPIVQFLHDASRKAMDSEGFKKACDAIYFISDPMSPAELRAALDRDTVFFGEMVKQLKLKK